MRGFYGMRNESVNRVDPVFFFISLHQHGSGIRRCSHTHRFGRESGVPRMRLRLIVLAVLILAGYAAPARAGSQANVLTQHNDAVRSGVTFGESTLTAATVSGG